MSAWWLRHRGRFEVEIVLAFFTGAAAFVLAALLCSAARSAHVPTLVLGPVLVAGVLAVARYAGVVYAVPVAVVTLDAFDWYFLPPLRALDTATVFVLAVFILTSVLVAEVASRSGRRAHEVERDRSALADAQAALRRVATLVAHGVAPADVFAAVAREVGQVLGVTATYMSRYDPDGSATSVGSWSADGTHLAVGTRAPLDDTSVSGLVFKTGRPARMDDYDDASAPIALVTSDLGVRSSVGAPIVVGGRLWGVMIAASGDNQTLPADTESRIAAFTELVATAVSNTEARTEWAQLAGEQAALRRVATLVAEGAAPAEVFETVTREVGILSGADLARMERYESGDSVIGVAGWSRGDAPELAVGTRFSLEGASIAAMILEASRPVRVDSFADAHGPIAQEAQGVGIRSSVGCPIVVDGRLWGVIAASSKSAAPFPPGTESQIAEFTELVATAIANTEARTELAASRARIVAATDQTRRRFERDLHDGVQQRLVSLLLELRTSETISSGREEPRTPLSRVGDGLSDAIDQLRELSRGIHPAILSEGGLRPALRALARRSAVPVELDVTVDKRLEERVEVAAYYVVSEALTNTAKHAQASVTEVRVETHNGTLELTIRDDGVGGADPTRGSGLIGLTDRVEALGGTLVIVSTEGAGTLLHAQLPVDAG
ncbi:MAG: hypothetical protein QOG15_309 [Solirubrobacteraceae bacterium]|jgi:signal transduction histidine kinase/type II secretory pathway pseudopilin PulG|nr:hypothetical protein [Solirubrobacteraceae bacterium]